MPLQRFSAFFKSIFTVIAIASLLSACGGSGPSGSTGTTGSTGSTGEDTTTAAANTLTLAWEDNPSDSTVLDTSPRTLLITLKEGDGKAIAEEIVEVSTSLGVLFPSSGNVATNASGVASIQLDVTGAEEGEAGSITVVHTDSATSKSVTARKTFTATISPSNTKSGLKLEALFFLPSILDATTNSQALADYSGDLATFRVSEQAVNINAVQNGLFVVRVLNANDLPVTDAIVNIATTAGTLTPASGKVLTNNNGVAYVTVSSGNSDPGAAGTMTASIQEAIISKNFSVGSVSLQLGFDTNHMGIIGVNGVADGSITLSPAGTASLRVTVFDEDGNVFTTPLTINFTSTCASAGEASIDTGIRTINGVVSATYEATGCATTDSIQASVVELADVTALGALTVVDAPANSIRFISATPNNIALKGTGGTNRQESSTVVFEVIDEAGQPKSGELVSVKLSTVTGGISLTGDVDADGDLDNSATDERLTSNAQGRVSVIVNSGTVATSVRTVASIMVGTEEISSVSDNLIVSTGLADQNSMSLSATILTPAGYDFDGFETSLNIRAADAFNNPVPDGTTVNFTTEYGRIVDSCTTASGTCSVTWNSQNPRRPDNTDNTGPVPDLANRQCDSNMDGNVDSASGGTGWPLTGGGDVPFGVPCPMLSISHPGVASLTGFGFTSVLPDSETTPTNPGQVFGGRSTILAYAIGEESFVDANGNGQYDEGESFVDMPEAFIDHNEDGVFGNFNTVGACISRDMIKTAAGTTPDLGKCDTWQTGGEEEEFVDFNVNGQYDQGNGVYNGTLCPEGAAASVCVSDLITVSDSLTLNVGGSTPFIGIYSTDNIYLAGGDAAVDVTDADNPNVRRIYVSDLLNGRLPGGTTVSITSDNCEVQGVSEYEVFDSSAFGNHAYDIFVGEDTSTDKTSGLVTITVSVPARAGNVVTTATFGCTDAD